MIESLENFDWTRLLSWVTVFNIFDIIIVAFFIYQLVRISRGTRATELLKGILFVILIKFFSSLLQLRTTEFIVDFIIDWYPIALVVIFQPELRRGLQHIGRGSLFSIRKEADPVEDAIGEIVEAVKYMSRRRIGALISIEQDSSLSEYIKTGTILDARISTEIIINAFIPNTPLHDGAMIISHLKIASAASYLPLSESAAIPKKYGTRHRAAIGLSEDTDAITIVVSEETGLISVAHRSNLMAELTTENLSEYLINQLVPSTNESETGMLGNIVEAVRKAVTGK